VEDENEFEMIKMSTVVNQVTHDLPDELLKVFATSSVRDFNNTWYSWQIAHRTFGTTCECDPDHGYYV